VIRNLVLAKLKPGITDDKVDRLVNELQGMQIPGMINLTVARDAGLREGNLDLVVVTDLDDEDAYRRYDQDPEHNRIRRDLVAPIVERVERIQYRV
jgi:Stress responsive A/B Barrel Domain